MCVSVWVCVCWYRSMSEGRLKEEAPKVEDLSRTFSPEISSEPMALLIADSYVYVLQLVVAYVEHYDREWKFTDWSANRRSDDGDPADPRQYRNSSTKWRSSETVKELVH